MNEPKFTPGPWLNQENMEGYADIVIPGEYIARVAKETNANLIASAPDLYAALAEIVDTLDASDFAHWVATARAALAKAVSHD